MLNELFAVSINAGKDFCCGNNDRNDPPPIRFKNTYKVWFLFGSVFTPLSLKFKRLLLEHFTPTESASAFQQNISSSDLLPPIL